jgi:4-oxalocrotonate tautomerase family enzyme
MPTIRLTSIDTHTDDQIQAFMEGVTRLAQETLGASEEAVIVHVEMLPATRYMRGGLTVAARRSATAN